MMPESSTPTSFLARLAAAKPASDPPPVSHPYLPVLKALQIVGVTPEVKAGKLVIDLDELLRAEYTYLTDIDIVGYFNGKVPAAGADEEET
jgi:hypothetical protein